MFIFVSSSSLTDPSRFPSAPIPHRQHEVPMYQPARALAMMERFIAGKPLSGKEH